MSGSRHDFAFLGEGVHVWSEFVSRGVRIFKVGRHFRELWFEGVRYMNVTLHNPKEGLVPDGLRPLKAWFGPSLHKNCPQVITLRELAEKFSILTVLTCKKEKNVFLFHFALQKK